MQTIHDRFSALSLAEVVCFQNLQMVPILGPDGSDPDYLTLDEALAQGFARVTETSEAGAVPELRFENISDQAVLLLDGEELVGAKQNRVLNLSILAPAKTTITIPVSCVESGRWSWMSPEFSSKGHAFYAAGRAAKASHVTESLRTRGNRGSRQGEVWDDIATKSARMGSLSKTAAMDCLYDDFKPAVEGFINALRPIAGQVGAIFSINGNIRGLELFDFSATLRKLLPKLVGSYALDAIDEQGSNHRHGSDNANAFLASACNAHVSEHSAIGEGNDVRLSAQGLSGGALLARGRVVNLCAFRVEGQRRDKSPGPSARMTRASSRHRWSR